MTSVLPNVEVGDHDVDDHDQVDGPARASDASENDVGGEGRAVEAALEPVERNPAVTAESQLTERQRRILVFERQWWRHAGSKEQAIREQFDLSATRYYQMLNQLLDRPEALAFDPLLVGRLRRLRATRARTRTRR